MLDPEQSALATEIPPVLGLSLFKILSLPSYFLFLFPHLIPGF